MYHSVSIYIVLKKVCTYLVSLFIIFRKVCIYYLVRYIYRIWLGM